MSLSAPALVRPSREFSLSAFTHAHDPRIWYTDAPADLALAEDPDVKAVILMNHEHLVLNQDGANVARLPRKVDTRRTGSGHMYAAFKAALNAYAQPLLNELDYFSKGSAFDIRPRLRAAPSFHLDGFSQEIRKRLVWSMAGKTTVFLAGDMDDYLCGVLTRGDLVHWDAVQDQKGLIDSVPQGAIMALHHWSRARPDVRRQLLHSEPWGMKGARLGVVATGPV